MNFVDGWAVQIPNWLVLLVLVLVIASAWKVVKLLIVALKG